MMRIILMLFVTSDNPHPTHFSGEEIMKRKERMWFKAVCVIVMGMMVSAANAGVLSDDFSVARNYLTQPSASFWDGYTANDGVQTDPQDCVVSALQAADGKLTITSAFSDIQATWDDGVALYTTVPAGVDFTATVKVVGGSFESLGNPVVYYNGGGLLARGADANSINNMDFLTLVAFDMPGWNAVYLLKSNDNTVQSEQAIGPGSTTPVSTVAAYPWQRMTRVGDIFTCYVSTNGTTWMQIGDAVQRTDLTGSMEVGLFHCTYTDAVGSAVFDNFSIEYPSAAYAPVPKSRQGMVSNPDNPLFTYVPLSGQVLSWSAPSDPNILPSPVVTYDVYLSGGTDPNMYLVSNDQTGTSYTPSGTFPMDTTYKWYIVSTYRRNDNPTPVSVTSPVWKFHTLPPNVAPVANAGEDLYTWPDAVVEPDPAYITATLNGSAADDGLPLGRTLTYLWSVESTTPTGYTGGITLNNVNIANPVATIAVTTTDVQYELKLTVTEVIGAVTYKSDTDFILIKVYSNSCEASRAKSSANALAGDLNLDCFVTLADFAEMAQNWLKDSNIARPN
jgi:hypothetical protein